jgi:hypothetical protein
MSQTQTDVVKIIGNVTAKAQADPAFRDRYVSDPRGTLTEAGLQLPSELQFKVIVGDPGQLPENTNQLVHLVVPVVRENVQDESLATAASASCQSTASTCFTVPSCASCASSASTRSC